MVWQWSHTSEGIEAVRENIAKLTTDQLCELYAEWKAFDADIQDQQKDDPDFTEDNVVNPGSYFDEEVYKKELEFAKQAGCPDIFAAYIFDRASAYQTCDNGGFNAYVSPYGTTVSFS